jgi:hypothetical protein
MFSLPESISFEEALNRRCNLFMGAQERGNEDGASNSVRNSGVGCDGGGGSRLAERADGTAG